MGGDGSGRKIDANNAYERNLVAFNNIPPVTEGAVYLPNFMGLQDAVKNGRSSSNFILSGGSIVLGASPPTTGAIRVDGSSYSNVLFNAVNGARIGRIVLTSAGDFQILAEGGSDLTFGNSNSTNQTKWTMNGADSISAFKATQATARIIGGSTNGLAIRDSSNSRDNFLIADNGTILTQTNTNRSGSLNLVAASNERKNGFAFINGNAGEATMLHSRNDATSWIQLIYRNDTDATMLSALEIQNVTTSGNKGSLLLMKSGGNVGIGTSTPSKALEVNGSVVISGGALGSGAYFIGASGGVTASITSADLVGKTILVSGGIIVGYG